MINSLHISTLAHKEIAKKVAIVCGLLVLLLTPVFLNPTEIGLPTCYFKAATGFSCPNCGMTRSVYAFSHLRVQESIQFHPLGPVIYAALLFLFLKFVFETVTLKIIRIKIDPFITKITLLTFFYLWSGFWIIRFIGEL
jgi:hypothetical protein